MAAVLGVTACGGEKRYDYPPSAVDAFTTACVQRAIVAGASAAAADSSCACAIEELERQFSYERFAATDARIRTAGGGVPPDWRPIVDRCARG